MAKKDKKPKQPIMLDKNKPTYWIVTSIITGASAIGAFAILGVLFFAPEFLPAPSSPPPVVQKKIDALSSQIATLNSQVEKIDQKTKTINPNILQNRLNILESKLTELAGSSTKMQSVIQSLSDISQDLGANSDTVNTVTKISSLVTDLNTRLETLDSTVAQTQTENTQIKDALSNLNQNDLEAAGLLLAVTQLRAILGSNTPFEQDLDSIKDLIADDAELTAALDNLSPFAANGIAGKEQLLSDLDEIQAKIIETGLDGDKKAVGKLIQDKLSNYVSVYKKNGGTLPIDSTQAILRRAKGHIERSNIDQGIQELSKIRGPAQQLIAPFVDEAKARAMGERIADKLVGRAADVIRKSTPNQNNSNGNLF